MVVRVPRLLAGVRQANRGQLLLRAPRTLALSSSTRLQVLSMSRMVSSRCDAFSFCSSTAACCAASTRKLAMAITAGSAIPLAAAPGVPS